MENGDNGRLGEVEGHFEEANDVDEDEIHAEGTVNPVIEANEVNPN